MKKYLLAGTCVLALGAGGAFAADPGPALLNNQAIQQIDTDSGANVVEVEQAGIDNRAALLITRNSDGNSATQIQTGNLTSAIVQIPQVTHRKSVESGHSESCSVSVGRRRRSQKNN